MFSKPTSELTYDDIHDLVKVRKVPEGHHLDYKEAINQKKLHTYIVGFANSGGGFLIVGVSNDLEIVGIDPIYQNKPVVEWMNQIFSSQIEPPVAYLDPKAIEVPESNKVVIVIQIPESSKKPHISTSEFSYYVRLHDSTKMANHHLVRDMFDVTRNRSNEVEEFLKKRNLYDDESVSFGLNKHSAGLLFDRLKAPEYQPRVLFSLIPKFINEERVDFKTLKQWLIANYNNYPPVNGISLLFPTYSDPQLDGEVFKDVRNGYSPYYFQVLQNGFVESGLSRSFFHTVADGKNRMALTLVCGYEIMMLHFAKRFCQFINYFDEMTLQVSVCNVNSFSLDTFHSEKQHRYYHDNFQCTNHTHFKLISRFTPSMLNDSFINTTVQKHSERICRAFGSSEELAFGKDGKVDMGSFNQFGLSK